MGNRQTKLLLPLLLAFSLKAAAQDVATQNAATERFVPAGAVLELRSTAAVAGPEVRLEDVVRWNDAGAAVCEPLAKLVVGRFSAGATCNITLDGLRRTLGGAGVALGSVRLQGPLEMQVRQGHADMTVKAAPQSVATSAPAVVEPEEHGQANEIEPITAGEPRPAVESSSPAIESRALALATPVVAPHRATLRQLLERDASHRLGLEADVLDVQLETADPTVLELSQPTYQFTIVPRMIRRIGPASWRVTVRKGDEVHDYDIRGNIRQWMTQVFATRPLAQRQEIASADVEVRRVLVERAAADAPLATMDGVIGQAAARNIDIGAPVTAKMLQPLVLVRANQVITVISQFGDVQIRSAMRSVEPGVMGQVIKARNEATRQTIDVEVIGSQTGRVVGSRTDTATATASTAVEPVGAVATAKSGVVNR